MPIKVGGKRRADIDLLRSVGVLAVVLAHCEGLPNKVMQARNFDVVLMVIVMAISFVASNGIKAQYPLYVKKRFRRLILPAWTFLLFFFMVYGLIQSCLGIPAFEMMDYIDSFLMSSGIPGRFGCGYVWILRVFFTVSILLPCEFRLVQNKTTSYSVFLFGAMLIVWGSFSPLLNGTLNNRLCEVIVYGIAYSIIAYYGLLLEKLNIRQLQCASGIFLLLYIVLAFRNGFANTQIDKYPPGLYYIAFAFFVSTLLYIFSKTKIGEIIGKMKVIYWLSQNSYWFYLWHIVSIYLLKINTFHRLCDNWVAQYLFILSFASILTIIQNQIKRVFKRLREER